MTKETNYIGSAEVCDLLHIDRSTLSRWVASSRITPSMKLPGQRGAYVFDPAEVERVRLDLAKAERA